MYSKINANTEKQNGRTFRMECRFKLHKLKKKKEKKRSYVAQM